MFVRFYLLPSALSAAEDKHKVRSRIACARCPSLGQGTRAFFYVKAGAGLGPATSAPLPTEVPAQVDRVGLEPTTCGALPN